MRRLLCLSAGLLLTLSLLGCPAKAPADDAAAAGAPADQGTIADTPSEDISTAEEKSGTPLKLRGTKAGSMEDRTSASGEEGGAADATPTNPNTTGPAPSLEEVEGYLTSILYPGSTFVSGEGPQNSGKVIIAMTQANVPASTVRTHFEGKGARTIDSRGEGQGLSITMELLDQPKGVKVGIAITQLGSASGSCLVNYSAYPIPTGPAPSNDGPATPPMPESH